MFYDRSYKTARFFANYHQHQPSNANTIKYHYPLSFSLIVEFQDGHIYKQLLVMKQRIASLFLNPHEPTGSMNGIYVASCFQETMIITVQEHSV